MIRDDSEIEEMIFDDDIDHMIMVHLVEHWRTEARGEARRSGIFPLLRTVLGSAANEGLCHREAMSSL